MRRLGWVVVLLVMAGCDSAREDVPKVRGGEQFSHGPHDLCYDFKGIEQWYMSGAWAFGPPPGDRVVPEGRNDLCEYGGTCWYDCPCHGQESCGEQQCELINEIYGIDCREEK